MSREGKTSNPEMPQVNPVGVRRPLLGTIQEVDAREPQTSAVRKLAENQIAFCVRLDAMDHDLVQLGQSMLLGFQALAERVNTIALAIGAMDLPPMRRREDSAHVIAETAARVSEDAKREAQRLVDDPERSLTPEAVEQLVDKSVKSALAEQREADRIKQLEAADAQRKEEEKRKHEADEKHAEDNRKTRRDIVVGLVVGIVLAIVGAYVTYLQGRITERAEAAKTPPAVVQVPVVVSAPTPSIAPASVPAAVTPPHTR